MKRLLPALCFGSLVWLTACSDGTDPSKTGVISLNLLFESPALSGPSPESRAPTEPQTHLDNLRVTVSGPTSKTATIPCNGTCTGVIDGLEPGTYSLTIEGLVGTQVAHYGQTSGVSVVAGDTATASVSMPSFQPVLVSLPDTTEVLHFPVSFQAVAGATSYVVEWATSPNFTGASSVTVTGTSTEVTVTQEAQYYVQVRAVNDQVGNNGLWSAPGAVVATQGVATVTVTPASPTINAGATQQFTAAAVDGDGAAVTGVTFFWSSSNHNVATVDQNGLATAINSGQVTITAVGKGQPGSATLTVGTQAATQLAFTVGPTSSTAGEDISPAIQVEVRDASGNRVSSARDAVTLAIAANPGSGTLAGTKVVNAINGIASFSGIWLDKVGTGYTLSAASGSLTGATSSAFDIAAGPKAKLQFSVQPADAEGNSVFTTELRITDAYGNVVPTATDATTIEFDRRPPFSASASLLGTRTKNAVAGVVTFDDLRVDVAGTGYALRARAGELAPASSAEFTVSLTFVQTDAGFYHTCGVTTNGSAYCWGNNGSGELGIGTFQRDSVPRLVGGGLDFAQVSAGNGFTCGLTTGNLVFCWGTNGSGQLGIGSFGGTRPEPSQVQDPAGGPVVFTLVTTGHNHACALTEVTGAPGPAFCWGYDGYGQVGNDAPQVDVNLPTIIAGGFTWKDISAGGYHTCAVRSNDQGYCWGRGTEGQIGDATIVGKPTPTLMTTLGIAEMQAGEYHACLRVSADNSIRCWGYNNEGQVGIGNFTSPQSDDQPISSQLTWAAVDAGGRNSCMIDGNAAAYCMGYDPYGQLGNGSPEANVNVREAVVGGISFASLTVGQYHTCGVTAAGAVWCWGRGNEGQMGNGVRISPNSQPVAVLQQ